MIYQRKRLVGEAGKPSDLNLISEEAGRMPVYRGCQMA